MVPQYEMAHVPIAWKGSAWQWQVGFVDLTTGEPMDYTNPPAGYTLATTLRDKTGKVLATLNNLGTGDGTITGDANGLLTWYLSAAKVNALPTTRTYRGGTDPRVSQWRTRGLIVFDLTETWTGAPTFTLLASRLTVSAQIHA